MDNFDDFQPGLESPGTVLHEVTPDDDNDLPFATRAINVAGSGVVVVTTVGGSTGSIMVAAGVPFALRVARVWATGTTATGIVALA